jgi:hypothetical protein
MMMMMVSFTPTPRLNGDMQDTTTFYIQAVDPRFARAAWEMNPWSMA